MAAMRELERPRTDPDPDPGPGQHGGGGAWPAGDGRCNPEGRVQ